MKTNKLIFLFILLFTLSCDDDDDPIIEEVIAETVTNLDATMTTDYSVYPPVETGDYTRFSFSTGETTRSETDWDIAFRGTKILVNGGAAAADDQPSRSGNAGAYIVNSTFNDVLSVSPDLFKQDSETSGLAIPTGSGNGWYTYMGAPSHAIVPTAGKILIFKTHDGKYAKVEILSYYKDAPENPNSNDDEEQFYTFRYIYQPNAGDTTLE